MEDQVMNDYISGDKLLAAFELTTREQKLEQACKALMQELDRLHAEHLGQSLEYNLSNQDVFCSCADAYRMGHAALSN
jgi:hypothetical protein